MDKIIDGKTISKQILNDIKNEIHLYNWKNKIGLAVIIIGNRSDSTIYVKKKIEACNKVGINSYKIELNSTVNNETVCNEIELLEILDVSS